MNIHTKVTATFHLDSGFIRGLATPTSVPSTLEPFIAYSILPACSLLDCQTTQAWLAAPNLPQPRVAVAWIWILFILIHRRLSRRLNNVPLGCVAMCSTKACNATLDWLYTSIY